MLLLMKHMTHDLVLKRHLKKKKATRHTTGLRTHHLDQYLVS